MVPSACFSWLARSSFAAGGSLRHTLVRVRVRVSFSVRARARVRIRVRVRVRVSPP